MQEDGWLDAFFLNNLTLLRCKDMVMNVDTSNDPSIANNNELGSQQYIVERISFSIALSGEQTEGRYSLLEAYFPPGSKYEIPLHAHSNETLLIYVMDGTFSFVYENEAKPGSTGMIFKFEKGIAHSYKKIGQEHGRLLLLYIPSGFENFFKDLSKTDFENRRKFGEDDPIMVQLLEKNYGIRMLLNS
jgi:quercetin dioxygenase-like cupin family protein